MKPDLHLTPKRREALAAVAQYGSENAAAIALGIHRSTLAERLRPRAKTRTQAPAAPAPTGAVAYRKPVERPLPAKGKVKRYLLTTAQINTDVHEAFWSNLLAYHDHLGAELIVARMTYDQRAFRRPDLVKTRAAVEGGDGAYWYADEVLPYLNDGRIRLAPGLQFAGELNILPTAVRPLNGLAGYTGRDSTIVPHAKLALESVPTGRNEPTKFLYTTGAVTLRNYVQKRAGQVAEFHHGYAALIVEVLSDGRWWVRQINASSAGDFQDLTTVVEGGRVREGQHVDAIHWGDIHASEMDPNVREICWGKGGVLDALRPKYQFDHDLHSHRAASHHERKSARTRYERWLKGQDDVAAEVESTREFLRFSARPWCQTIIVPSNHNEHADRWLDEGDPREDPRNSALWHEANAAMRRALAAGEDWDFASWAFSGVGGARVLKRDESFVLHDIEMGWHGDLGPNGARGSTQGLLRTCRRISKGHDHQATIRDGVYSAGVCAQSLDYARGPSAWSVSHVVVYPNGKRAILTQSGDAYWAPRGQEIRRTRSSRAKEAERERLRRARKKA